MKNTTEGYHTQKKYRIQTYLNQCQDDIKRSNKGFNLGVALILDTFVFNKTSKKGIISHSNPQNNAAD